jgi:predicted small lipoprotein YifL
MRILMVCALLLMVTTCGQKGPLHLPPPSAPPAALR